MLILMFLLFIMGYILVGYKPFIIEQLAFDVIIENDKTYVKNNNFDISFFINEKCELKSELQNYIFFKGLWLGKLKCKNSSRDVLLYIWDYDEDLLDRRSLYNSYEGNENIIVNYNPEGSKFDFLTVLDTKKEKIFNLSIYETEKELFDIIVDSLEVNR